MQAYDSQREFQLYLAKHKLLDPRIVDVGWEIEQRDENDSMFTNPNPENLPAFIPVGVKRRSQQFLTGNLRGHHDGSDPWEFALEHNFDLVKLLDLFNKIVGGEYWCYHNQFRRGSGASSHIHVSLRGDFYNDADGQRTLPAEFWQIAYNDLVTLLPLCAPFFCFGQKWRQTLSTWARPVYDRFTLQNTIDVLSCHSTRGIYTGQIHHEGVHDYTALSWNNKGKSAMTIEIRANESHPYWGLPAMQLFSSLIRATLTRAKSVKLKDHPVVIPKVWQGIIEKDIYPGLLGVENVAFHKGRDIPYITRPDQERVYPTALDLFRVICRRFINSKKDSPLKFGKVMRMFSDFIDLGKIPTHLVWDIDETYRLLYEDKNKKSYQDEWLYYGSKAVLPLSERIGDYYPQNYVKNLI